MIVKDLITKLKEMDGDLTVVVDAEEIGFYNVEDVTIFINDDGDEVVSIDSSNES